MSGRETAPASLPLPLPRTVGKKALLVQGQAGAWEERCVVFLSLECTPCDNARRRQAGPPAPPSCPEAGF